MISGWKELHWFVELAMLLIFLFCGLKVIDINFVFVYDVVIWLSYVQYGHMKLSLYSPGPLKYYCLSGTLALPIQLCSSEHAVLLNQ